jgi:tRNA dimethylallyltransferase
MAPLVVIVGPTASGKTDAAIALAEQFSGEIICADSRTIYKYMDIGTAKPTAAQQARVPHWGLDLIEPGERYTVADFKTYANQKITEIRERGNIPFLVGGTGLYIDAVVLDYQFGPDVDQKQRHFLEMQTTEQLHEYCLSNNIKLPNNKYNKRYVIRAIENEKVNNSSNLEPIENTIIVGIATDRDVLRQRIKVRSQHLFEQGMIEEADRLAATYGWDSEAMTGNIYKLVHKFRSNELNEDELITRFEIADWQLAKRQLTWLKRRDFIHWLPLEQVVPYLSDRLAQEAK